MEQGQGLLIRVLRTVNADFCDKSILVNYPHISIYLSEPKTPYCTQKKSISKQMTIGLG